MLLVVTVIVFFLMRVVPGNPLDSVGEGFNATYSQELLAVYGLDKNLFHQYWIWLSKAVTGDLGKTVVAHQPVWDDIKQRLPITLELSLLSMLITALFGIPIGVISAVKKNSIFDVLGSGFSFIAVSVPHFWLGLMMILLFSLYLGWLPPGRFVAFSDNPILHLRNMIMPSFALGIGSTALVVRLLRSGMLEVLSQEYVTVARSKGLGERTVIFRHALRNALLPVITVFGLIFGRLFGGAIIIESVFTLPGMGHYILTSIHGREYTALQAAVIVIVAGVLISNLLVDILYGYLDPRIRQQG
jgi:peptide/nickel transport system permease protein